MVYVLKASGSPMDPNTALVTWLGEHFSHSEEVGSKPVGFFLAFDVIRGSNRKTGEAGEANGRPEFAFSGP